MLLSLQVELLTSMTTNRVDGTSTPADRQRRARAVSVAQIVVAVMAPGVVVMVPLHWWRGVASGCLSPRFFAATATTTKARRKRAMLSVSRTKCYVTYSYLYHILETKNGRSKEKHENLQESLMVFGGGAWRRSVLPFIQRYATAHACRQ